MHVPISDVYGVGLDEPLIQVSAAGVLTYLHADRLGSIIATSDATGMVTNKSKYSPFGENAPIGTTFGFTGQRCDAETGLYYYKNRHYAPAIDRFLQTDPIGYGIKLDDCGCGCSCSSPSPTKQASVNLYGYAANDPLNKIDPLGLSVLEVVIEEIITEGPAITQNVVNTLGVIGAGALGILAGNKGQIVAVIPNKAGTRQQCLDDCENIVADLTRKEKEKRRDQNGCLPKDVEREIDEKFNNIRTDCINQCAGVPVLRPVP